MAEEVSVFRLYNLTNLFSRKSAQIRVVDPFGINPSDNQLSLVIRAPRRIRTNPSIKSNNHNVYYDFPESSPMVPAPDSESSDIFPMPIACTGCATRYRIDRPRAFTCPHCGNHIEILQDGRVEIIPKKALSQDVPEIVSTPVIPTAKSVEDTAVEEKPAPEATGTARDAESIPKITDPSDGSEPTGDKMDHEEEVIAIKPRRKMEPLEEPITEAEPVEEPPRPREKKVIKEPEISEKAPAQKKRDTITETEEQRENGEADRLREEIRKEEARLKQLRKEQEELEAMKERSGGKVSDEKGDDSSTPVLPSTYQKAERRSIGLDRDVRKKAIIAIGVVAILIVAAILYSIIMQDDFSVKMPEEKIGDRGTYDVKGDISVSSPDGIAVRGVAIRDLEINLKGPTTYQINDTVEITDGFGIEQDCLDKYLWQDLSLSGYADLFTGQHDIPNAGTLETKTSSYISLISQETIRNKVFSELDIDILSYLTGISVQSEDSGIYYPSGEGSGYNLFDLREREYEEGDEGDFAGGQLRWKAEEVEEVYKWDCLRLHVTENNSDADWRTFSGDIWVASECSLPVKIRAKIKVDTTKLTSTQSYLLSFIIDSDGEIELDYTATMKGFDRGDRFIPWDPSGKDPSVEERGGVQFDEDWVYGPLIRINSTSFDPDFSPEIAAEFAVNESSDLRSYVNRHEDEVYVVDAGYSVVNGTQYWELLFGYRVPGIIPNMNAYNITVRKVGTKLSIESDPGEETINNPSNSRDEVEQALNIADVEGIYKGMDLVGTLFYNRDSLDFNDNSSGRLSFEVQNNYLHTGLTLTTGFNPLIQNTVPAGYGYYLRNERSDGRKYDLTEGMVDAQNGRIIYELDHFQNAQY